MAGIEGYIKLLARRRRGEDGRNGRSGSALPRLGAISCFFMIPLIESVGEAKLRNYVYIDGKRL